MSYEHKNTSLAARLSTKGFVFSVRHALAPVIDRSHAFLDDLNARSLRQRGLKEIADLPDYLRDDIGIPRAAHSGTHNKL